MPGQGQQLLAGTSVPNLGLPITIGDNPGAISGKGDNPRGDCIMQREQPSTARCFPDATIVAGTGDPPSALRERHRPHATQMSPKGQSISVDLTLPPEPFEVLFWEVPGLLQKLAHATNIVLIPFPLDEVHVCGIEEAAGL